MLQRSIRLIVPVLLVVILTSCDGTTTPPTSQDGTPLPTPVDISQPDGVAQTFLDAWSRNDYSGMWSLLNANSQAAYPLTDFTDWYTNITQTMTLESVHPTLNSVLPQGNSAQATFTVTYNTRQLGPIEQEMTMYLTYDGERWGVVWSPQLIVEGLCDNCVLSLNAQKPARANIYDRNGDWLAQEDAAAVSINIVPGEVNDDFEDQMLEQLSTICRRTPDFLLQQYGEAREDLLIYLCDTDLDTYQANRAVIDSYPALQVFEKFGRRYYNALAPHVIGYMGFIPENQCEAYQAQGYTCDTIIGLTGLEAWGEEFLAGKPSGNLSVFTTGGEFIRNVVEIEPVPSQSIYTTLDRRLQTIVQDALQDAYYAGRDTWAGGQFPSPGAAVVVIEIDTGNILAMASYPDYDQNYFHPSNQAGLDSAVVQATIQGWFNDYRKPFLNRATEGQYPPGSVFKVVSMTAALDDSVTSSHVAMEDGAGYDMTSTYTCNGIWTLLGPGNYKTDWLAGGHGTITLRQSLTYSCDPFYYQVGWDTGNADFSLIPRTARGFGLGSPTGLVQLNEAPGLIPDEDWMRQAVGEEWSIADSVNIAIGQGDVLVTPLQIANMMAAIGNGGTLYRPQLVQQIALIGEPPSYTSQPEVLGTLPLSQQDLADMQRALWDVQRDPGGTASWILRQSNLALAGKTGTAQAPGETSLPHAWFAGYAPADNPQIAIAVVVENSGEGSNISAPIFRRIAEEYFLGGSEAYPDFWFNPEDFEEIIAPLLEGQPGG